jgi:outer membrane protein assembly factor BamB
MNRRSLSLIAIGLIAIIVVSSVIVYKLGLMRSSVPSSAPWQRSLKNFAFSLTVDDGKVFTTDDPGNVYCFDSQNGESIWNVSVIGRTRSSKLVISDGRVYFGFEDGLACLDENDGKTLWILQAGPDGASVEAVEAGRLYTSMGILNATTGEFLLQPTNGHLMKPNGTSQGWSVPGYPLNGDPYDGNYLYGTGAIFFQPCIFSS